MRDAYEFASEFVERLGNGYFRKARLPDDGTAPSDEFVETELKAFAQLCAWPVYVESP